MLTLPPENKTHKYGCARSRKKIILGVANKWVKKGLEFVVQLSDMLLDDNFPTTNIEALACGTPIVTFRTGGSIEAIGESHIYGKFTKNKKIISLRESISVVLQNGKQYYKNKCGKRVLRDSTILGKILMNT